MSTVRFEFPTDRKGGRELRTRRRTCAPACSRAARMLALAHYIERMIEDGRLADYAEAARALGLTRARITQVMSLLLLAPEIQEGILAGKVRGSERRLRCALREAEWGEQVSLVIGYR